MLQPPLVDVAFADRLCSLQERHHVGVDLVQGHITCRFVTNHKDESLVAFTKPARELTAWSRSNLPKQKREACAFRKQRVHATKKSNDYSVQ